MELENGIHLLSGVSDTTVHCGYEDDDPVNGYIIRIDETNYCIYEDPDDGYRSYGVFHETDERCTNTFPPQEVMVEVYNTGWIEEDDYYESKQEGMKITNPKDGSLILEIGTKWYDSYYPMAYCEYHPENLPINKDKEDSSELTVNIIARWYSEAEKTEKVLGIFENTGEILEGIVQENGLAFSRNKLIEIHPLLKTLLTK